MNAQSKLDEIVATIEGARAMPMSASCIVNRAEMLALLDELRELLPAQLREAESVLRDRDDVIDEGRREADRIIEAAQRERSRMLTKTEVAQEAAREAERLIAEAQQQSTAMRDEVDAYVDTKLANFEVVLTKTLSAVERGREKLRGRHPLDDLRDAVEAQQPGEPGLAATVQADEPALPS